MPFPAPPGSSRKSQPGSPGSNHSNLPNDAQEKSCPVGGTRVAGAAVAHSSPRSIRRYSMATADHIENHSYPQESGICRCLRLRSDTDYSRERVSHETPQTHRRRRVEIKSSTQRPVADSGPASGACPWSPSTTAAVAAPFLPRSPPPARGRLRTGKTPWTGLSLTIRPSL